MTRITTHPGEMLLEEFMNPYGLSARQVAERIGVPANRISELVRGHRSMTADTAIRLEALFGWPVHMWMGLQDSYDASVARSENDYSHIERYEAA